MSASRPLTALLTLAVTLVVAACVASRPVPANPFGGAGATADAERAPSTFTVDVTVRNRTSAAASVVAVGSRRRTVGTVETRSDETFQLRWTRRQELHFEVTFRTAGACRTRSHTVEPGMDVVLLLDRLPEAVPPTGGPPVPACRMAVS